MLRESDDAAAATAAAASAVKFMLIESEAAATSASFLPAHFSLLLFLRSSQPTAPTALTHTHARTHSSVLGRANQEPVAEIEPKRERWTHSDPLNAQTVTMIHRAEQRQRERECVFVCLVGAAERERERRERERERGRKKKWP